jgi:hypothetical protein
MTTAVSAPARQERSTRRSGRAVGRLLWLELRHNAMPWVLPVAIALFWFTSFRKTLAMPPVWTLRAAGLQVGVVSSFIVPVVGAAAWMGSREARRRLTDQVEITARPRRARLLVTWAATTIWALLGYAVCLAVVYGATARDATWGGPLWWPAAVAAASMPLYCAIGFAAGALLPGKLTAPATAVVSFFVLVLSTELISGSHSAWQISPVVTGPWDFGPSIGVAAFYPFLPDLSIAQLMFLTGLTVAALGVLALRGTGSAGRAVAATVATAGLLAAGTGVGLAGTGKINSHGMIAIPALHDAANDRPIPFTPVCSRAAIPVCVNPAYASYLPAVSAALSPVLTEIAGLPGAPARLSQAAATYQQEQGADVALGLTGPQLSGGTYRILLPDQFDGPPPLTASQQADQVRATTGPAVVGNFVGGDGLGASPAQQAVAAALSTDAGLPVGTENLGPPVSRGSHVHGTCGGRSAGCGSLGTGRLATGSPVYVAAHRFASLPLAARRAWLAQHLTALRAGQVTLGQLP